MARCQEDEQSRLAREKCICADKDCSDTFFGDRCKHLLQLTFGASVQDNKLLVYGVSCLVRDAGEIARRSIKATNKAEFKRVAANCEHDWNCRCRGLGCDGRRRTANWNDD